MKHMTIPANAVASSSGFTWLDESGIIIAVASPHDKHTLEHAHENISVVAMLAAGKRRPFLIDMSKVKAMTREARTFYASPEPAKHQNAVAIVSSSNVGNIVGNFFIGLTKPIVPTRMFSNYLDAKNWLIQYLEK